MKIDIQQNQGFEYLYGLPIDWDKRQMLSFGELTETILQIHSEAKSSAIRAVNRYATIRNYIIGFYIVEYEQKGNDRAVYGDRLLKRLVESIDVRGINETLLKNCRRFYVLYPQIKHLLTREKSPTISDFSEFESSAIDIVANLCNVIIELKNDEFKHSDLSQLNAYVSYFKRKKMT